jgi:hypothetical protein
MNTASFPMPCALRWRVIHPLIDEDGSCALIYDMERAAVLEVPQELQLHVAPALETGDPDDDLLTWLVDEDLLTTESWAGLFGAERDSGLGAPGWWSVWAIHRCDDEVHARISPADLGVAETLESVFKQSLGAPRVHLLLDWDGAFPGAPLIQQVLVEAGHRAAPTHQQIFCELVLDAHHVTRTVAAFLAASPLHLRLRCGAFPARASSSFSLLRGLAERTIVQHTLGAGVRLRDLWTWARRAGVRRLDAALSEAADVREYRNDLLAACAEMAADLAMGRMPIDYLPLTRMVRRLMGSEARFEPASDLNFVLDPKEDTPCPACWARSVCNHSSLLAAPVGEEPQEPSPERCAVWLAEAEAALRLYHRLAGCDPTDVLRLLGDAARMPLDPLGRREDLGPPKLPS